MTKPLIEFEWDQFQDDDNDWDALFVKVNGGKWFMAKPIFNTEDTHEIRKLIKNNDTGRW